MARGNWTPPPNWPRPPHPGWRPPPGWSPPPAWGPPPEGWNFYPEPTPGTAWWKLHWLHLAATAIVAIIIGASLAAGASGSTATRATASDATAKNSAATKAAENATKKAMSLKRDLTTETGRLTDARQSLKASRSEVAQLHHKLTAAKQSKARALAAKHSLRSQLTVANRSLAAAQSALRQARRQSVAPPSPPTRQPAVHSCTRTSTGNCIQGGEFCPGDSDGQMGYNADGKGYICRNGHWENP